MALPEAGEEYVWRMGTKQDILEEADKPVAMTNRNRKARYDT